MRTEINLDEEQREKNHITFVSVAAAIVLTLLKLIVGLLTGSLALLSDAAHSGLDAFSTIITFFSVRFAGRPADADHPYGHGRVENLSASVQGILLFVTAGAIIIESFKRIFLETVEVDTNIWTFAVMALSIGVDFWRSSMLMRAARKYHSPALEADAHNFRADMLASAAVILGLAFVAFAERTGRASILLKADPIAALVVAGIIVFVSGKIVFSAISVLVDRAPTSLRDRMTKAAAAVPGVIESRQVRLRESGNSLFADIVVTVPRTTSLAEAHTITERVEESIRDIEPRTETVVHVEPAITETESAADRIRAIALLHGTNTHHEQVFSVGKNLEASLHIEVGPQLSIDEAYGQARALRKELKKDNPRLQKVHIHMEVSEPDLSSLVEVNPVPAELANQVQTVMESLGAGAQYNGARFYRSQEGKLDAILSCGFNPATKMSDVHLYTERLEQALRERIPSLERVTIEAIPDHA